MTRAETEAMETLEHSYRWLFDPQDRARLNTVRGRMEKTLRIFESDAVRETAKRRAAAGLAIYPDEGEMPAW